MVCIIDYEELMTELETQRLDTVTHFCVQHACEILELC